MHGLEFLWDAASERVLFGKRYVGPESFPHDGWTLVAVYPAVPDSDGREARVYVAAMPARFYRVVSPTAGVDLATGSGTEMGLLAAKIAGTIAEGMIGACKSDPPEEWAQPDRGECGPAAKAPRRKRRGSK